MRSSGRPPSPRRRTFVHGAGVGLGATLAVCVASLLAGVDLASVGVGAAFGVVAAVALGALGARWALRPVQALVVRHEDDFGDRKILPPLGGHSLEALVARVYERQRQRLRLRLDELGGTVDSQRDEIERLTRALEAEQARYRRDVDELRRVADLRGSHLAYLIQELGRPLTAAIAASELVLDSALSEAQQRLLEMSRRALGGVAQLVDHYHVNAERPIEAFGANPRGLSLRRVVTAIARTMSAVAERRKLEIVVRFASEVPSRCLADPERLRQVLGAFIEFALERAQSGCVYVNVGLDGPARSVDGQACELRFSVEDDGPPLPRPEQQRLFEVAVDAQRLEDASGARWFQLVVARRLLMAAGGRAWVDSSSGSGTRLAFTFPVVRQKRVSVTTLYGRGAITEKATLVVDDVAHSRAVTSELLSSWRLLPTAVPDARQAVDALRSAARTKQPFDLLIIDRRVAEMDGVGLLDQIACDDNLGRRRVVLLERLSTVARPLPKAVRAMVGAVVLKPILHPARRAPRGGDLGPRTAADGAEGRHPPGRAPRSYEAARQGPGGRGQRRQSAVHRAHAGAARPPRHGREQRRRRHRLPRHHARATPEPFDIILMDIRMPVLDGVEATAIIRERERRSAGPHLPIVAVTAHTMPSDKERCLAVGMDGIVPKPVVEEVLLAEIEAHLPADFHQRAALAASPSPAPSASPSPAASASPVPAPAPASAPSASSVPAPSASSVPAPASAPVPAPAPAPVPAASASSVPAPASAPMGAAPAPVGAAFDERRLLDFAAGDAEFLVGLVDLFVETVPHQMEAIAEAIAAVDGDALRRAAHQLKGSVGNFSAERARRWAFELEKCGRSERFDEAPVAFERLAGEIEALQEGLERMVGRRV